MCDHRNPEKRPYVPVGNYRKINEKMKLLLLLIIIIAIYSSLLVQKPKLFKVGGLKVVKSIEIFTAN
jgi:hypothetical protein